MTRPYHFRDGWVLVLGDRYDLRKTLAAAEAVIDCLARRLAGGTSTALAETTSGRRTLIWPDPAKSLVRRFWERSAQAFDVADFAVAHEIGPLTVKVYLLGKTWCVYDAASGRLTTPRLQDVSGLDPAPTICLYGPETRPGSYALLEPETVDAVEEALWADLRDRGLRLERHVIASDPAAPERARQIAFITLSHAVYGVGRGPIRVHCVTPGGSDVRPTPLP